LRLWLDLQWIFERLAHELSFVVLPPETHPVRLGSMKFLSRYLEPTDRVLDVGCKHGDLARLIAPRVAETTGIDLDESALPAPEASNPLPSVRFLHGDAIEYCERNAGRFDVVVLCHVIEHLDDPGRLLCAAAGCRRGVFIEVPDFECTLSNEYRVLTQSELVYSDPDHVWEFGRRELRQLAAASGLEAMHEETQGGVIRAWCVPRPRV
jgi:2-polyprenyl-3-methyl-5-hydroxy-6-metoxy-1,4-benzoquinol methylase